MCNTYNIPSVPINPTTPTRLIPPTPHITTNPSTLRTFNTSLPIHRFDFPDAATQAAFHRSFALLRTEKDKADFMQRFFDNYDGQVSIPKRPARYDTSNDEALAKKMMDGEREGMVDSDGELARAMQEETPLPDTQGDGDLARALQSETPLPDTQRDVQLAQALQNEHPLPDTQNDAHLAQTFQDGIPRPVTQDDEAMARMLQEEMDHGHETQPQRPDRREGMHEDFGRMTFAEQRRRVMDGYRPVQDGYRPVYPGRGDGQRGERYPPPWGNGGAGAGRGIGGYRGYGGSGEGNRGYYGYGRG